MAIMNTIRFPGSDAVFEVADAAARAKLSNQSIQRVNAADRGIIGDGATDVTAAVQALFDSVDWRTEIYFPPGRYMFSGPVHIDKRVNIYGSPVSFTAAERIHTVFDFTRMTNDTGAAVYGLTTGYFTLVKDITFECDAYEFIEDRAGFLLSRSNGCYTSTVKRANIGALNIGDYGTARDLFFMGFSDLAIKCEDYSVIKDVAIRQCRNGISLGTDNTVDNVRVVYGETAILTMGGENTVSNIRADSLSENAITIRGGLNKLTGILCDWVWKNAVAIIDGKGNNVDMAAGRCGIRLYGINPATTPGSYTDTSAAVIRLYGTTNGNLIRMSNYRADLSDNNQGKWLFTPCVAIGNDSGKELSKNNSFDLTVGDVSVVPGMDTGVMRRFLLLPMASQSVTGGMTCNGRSVIFTDANRDNYATAFEVR